MTTQPSTTPKIDPGILSERHLGRYFSLLTPEGGIRWWHVLLTYAISHGFILACWNALYWDDWLVYSGGPDGVRDYFESCTNCTLPFRSEVEAVLIAPGPWLMRVLTFCIFPLIAFLFQRFLRRTAWLNEHEIGGYVLLVLFLPMYGARVAHIDFQYSVSLLLFMLGGLMTLSSRVLIRLVAIIPIFWSMFVASLQVFVVALILVLLIRMIQRPKATRFGSTDVLLILILAVSPIVHRYVLPNFLSSIRVVDGYNSIRPAFLIRGLLFTFLLSCPIVVMLFRHLSQRHVSRENWQLGIGLSILALGTFPYLAVGHFANFSDWILPLLPDESDWNSRHQLLQPFGFGLTLLSVAQRFRSTIKSVTSLILIALLPLNVATYSGYYLDSLKQREFLAQVEANKNLIENDTVLIIGDDATRFNARNRGVRAYEWTAMLSQGVGRDIIADSNSVQFCAESHPSKLVRVTATRGRLRSLLSRKIGIVVTFEDLPTCSLAEKSS